MEHAALCKACSTMPIHEASATPVLFTITNILSAAYSTADHCAAVVRAALLALTLRYDTPSTMKIGGASSPAL